jgi:formylglycine-generating enzyme required for sulfatase activity
MSKSSLAQQAEKSYVEKIPATELSLKMIQIPKGEFKMGSPYSEKGRNNDEGPQNNVEIDEFWMSEIEIPWEIYNLFVTRSKDASILGQQRGKEVSKKVDGVSGATTPYVEMSFGMGTTGYPAINMTQYAASKFCEWLSAATGHFYRLPTEAEWEYAAKAGSKSAYSYGNSASELDAYAWHDGNSEGVYHKVKTKEPNAWGLYDMHGNVAEWTLDQYQADLYNTRKGKNTKNPWVKRENLYPVVVKGGSWQDEAVDLRSAARSTSQKIWKMRDPQIPKSKWWFTDAPFVGFRIVRPVQTPLPAQQELYWKEKH